MNDIAKQILARYKFDSKEDEQKFLEDYEKFYPKESKNDTITKDINISGWPDSVILHLLNISGFECKDINKFIVISKQTVFDTQSNEFQVRICMKVRNPYALLIIPIVVKYNDKNMIKSISKIK